VRHDNGLVFGSKRCGSTVAECGLKQECTVSYIPEQNGLCERVIRTLK
jgi:putative transposase